MKKIIVLLIVILAGFAHAADVTITITIPSAKVADFSAAMEAYMPIPLVPDPTFVDDPNDPSDTAALVPSMSQKNWLKVKLMGFIRAVYRKGKIRLAHQAAVVDPNIVE